MPIDNMNSDKFSSLSLQEIVELKKFDELLSLVSNLDWSRDYHTFWYRVDVPSTTKNDWRLSDKQIKRVGVHIKELFPLCKNSNILEIPLDQIAYVSMHLSYDEFWKGKSYQKKKIVDISRPGIVVPKLRNPANLPYALLDGRHRITEMKKAGMTSSKFYVISKRELYPYIHNVDDQNRELSFRYNQLTRMVWENS